jgi:outer membrane protein assembly factor BamB
LGLIYQFRAYCCDIDSDGIMGVAKEPVPVLDLSANVLCLGDTLTWDLRDSYAPGSTIDAYAIDMDDGTQYFVDNGTHVYGATGTYTIEATVHEGTCRQQTIEAQVEVIDCDDGLFATFAYASLDGDGVWFYDFTAAAPAWEFNANQFYSSPAWAQILARYGPRVIRLYRRRIV